MSSSLQWSGLVKGWYGDTYGVKAKAAKGLEIRDHFKVRIYILSLSLAGE